MPWGSGTVVTSMKNFAALPGPPPNPSRGPPSSPANVGYAKCLPQARPPARPSTIRPAVINTDRSVRRTRHEIEHFQSVSKERDPSIRLDGTEQPRETSDGPRRVGSLFAQLSDQRPISRPFDSGALSPAKRTRWETMLAIVGSPSLFVGVRMIASVAGTTDVGNVPAKCLMRKRGCRLRSIEFPRPSRF